MEGPKPSSIIINTHDMANHSDAMEAFGNMLASQYDKTLDWYTTEFQLKYHGAFLLGVNGPLCLLGIVNNIITIIVFAKMGFKETTNVSLTAIACWDFLQCLTKLFTRMTTINMIYAKYIPFTFLIWYNTVAPLFLGNIVLITAHSSNMLAAYVAIERCLCVSMPFTVKHLLTRKTAIATALAIPAFVFATYSFNLACHYIAPVLLPISPTYTATIYTAYLTPFGEKNYGQWVMNYYLILNCVYPVITAIIMSVCTVVIVTHLKVSSKLRSKNTKGESGQMSTRDRKITKMLVVVFIFYIIYLVPTLVYTLFLIPLKYWVQGLSAFLVPFAEFFTLVNLSANLYIFYFMSSEFKRTVRNMFGLSVDKTRRSTC